MRRQAYTYVFNGSASAEEIQAALLMAVLAVENLHGESGVRLDARHFFDEHRGQCVIDASTPIGEDLNRLFVGFLRREFGDDAFQVQRAEPTSAGDKTEAKQ
jgi:hypothetical protein